jgi:hypothetical protein
MQCYTEILKEKEIIALQTSLLSFFRKWERIKLPEPQPSTSGMSETKQLPISGEASSLLASPPLSPTRSSDPHDSLP